MKKAKQDLVLVYAHEYSGVADDFNNWGFIHIPREYAEKHSLFIYFYEE